MKTILIRLKNIYFKKNYFFLKIKWNYNLINNFFNLKINTLYFNINFIINFFFFCRTQDFNFSIV
jgi:hypothetical protein